MKKGELNEVVRGISPITLAKRKAVAPLWQGPESNTDQGGVTQGLIAKWLVCRERFRLYAMEGLAPDRGFNHRIFYGDCWHVCEQNLQANPNTREPSWLHALHDHVSKACKQYPLNQQQIEHWYLTCRTQFPLYLQWWAQHPETDNLKPLLREQVFKVPYTLPSGRTVYLRGKWDGVDLLKGREEGIFLAEHKTKGDFDERQIKRQLGFDLQTMLYCVALTQDTGIEALEQVKRWDGKKLAIPICGVRYNVVRRPFDSSKGSIRRGKGKQARKLKSGKMSKSVPPESADSFYGRLAKVIAGAHGPEWKLPPGEHHFFKRWQVLLSQADFVKFRQTCLDPILENMADDYRWWAICLKTGTDVYNYRIRETQYEEHKARHYRMPYGVRSRLMDGGEDDVDEYLQTGSATGLSRVDNLFPELT